MSAPASVYDCLLPLMKARKVTLAPAEFHQAVNLAYHRFEAAVYDEDHRQMWDSLPAQFTMLVKDLMRHAGTPLRDFRVLDVGCGTGLGSALLLQTDLGKSIAHIDLLDTSPEMLARCATRAATWNVPHQTILGTLQDAPAPPYDLILASSVLHHIPDLAQFLRGIRALQHKGGYFLHIQDPNADHLRDPELLARLQELRDATRKRALAHTPLDPLRLAKRVWRKLTAPWAGHKMNHLELLNNELLRSGVIDAPMSDEEIWSITDIHVDNLPYSTRRGISLQGFQADLPEYRLVSSKSYAFFGRLWSTLPPAFQERETQFIEQGAPDGYKIAAVWARIE